MKNMFILSMSALQLSFLDLSHADVINHVQPST